MGFGVFLMDFGVFLMHFGVYFVYFGVLIRFGVLLMHFDTFYTLWCIIWAQVGPKGQTKKITGTTASARRLCAWGGGSVSAREALEGASFQLCLVFQPYWVSVHFGSILYCVQSIVKHFVALLYYF